MSNLAINGGKASAEPLKDYKWPKLYEEDKVAVVQALEHGYWGGLGDENQPHKIFEAQFAEYHNADYAVLVANGTVSLELSLKAGGVCPGDEVIVPAITFVASAGSIVSVGAVPIFVDVEKDTCQISAAAIEAAITPRTKGILIVHFGGYVADLDAIMALADKHGLIVIEDCAHAQGASWRNRRVGSWGTFGSFSFQESKSLSAGEGGLVLMKDEDMYAKAQLIRNIGRKANEKIYYHHVCASNWRMGGLQAALLLSQFSRFPVQAEQRHHNYYHLANALNQIEGIRCLPHDERITQMGCYFLIMDFDAGQFGCSRDVFVQAMRAEGVAWCTTGYNRPLYKEKAFEEANLRPLLHESIQLPEYSTMSLPHAERWTERMVTILHFYMTGDTTGVDLVLEAARKVKKHVSELVVKA